MRLIDGDQLLEWLDNGISEYGKQCQTSRKVYPRAAFDSYFHIRDKVHSGSFDAPSNQSREEIIRHVVKLQLALENIAFGRIEGDYGDVRQYARGVIGGNSDE